MKQFISLIILTLTLSGQTARETMVNYINGKLDFFSGKTEVGFMRYAIHIESNDFVQLKESWFINDITFKGRERAKTKNYTFLPTHIKSIGLTKDFNNIEFHFKEDYYIYENEKVITKIRISLEQSDSPKEVAKERLRLKNSLVFLFRNLINKKL